VRGSAGSASPSDFAFVASVAEVASGADFASASRTDFASADCAPTSCAHFASADFASADLASADLASADDFAPRSCGDFASADGFAAASRVALDIAASAPAALVLTPESGDDLPVAPPAPALARPAAANFALSGDHTLVASSSYALAGDATPTTLSPRTASAGASAAPLVAIGAFGPVPALAGFAAASAAASRLDSPAALAPARGAVDGTCCCLTAGIPSSVAFLDGIDG
jgi:hypothetical protein